MKTVKLLFIIATLLFNFSCNDNAQTKTNTQQVASEDNVGDSKVEPFAETIEEGNRLTEESLLSYFPSSILGYKNDGIHEYNNALGIISKTYDNANISITIYDYSNSRLRIENVTKNGITLKDVKTKYVRSETYQDADGYYVTERENHSASFSQNRIILDSPRFQIEITDKKGEQTPKEILASAKKTNLMKLLSIPIPQKKDDEASNVVVTNEVNKEIIDCDQLLPIEVVKTICNKTVTVKSTSFEKDYNCNRHYPDLNSSGSLIFLVTLYSRGSTAKSAVRIDKGEEIPNLGGTAIYFRDREDEYLKVGYKNYLLELRSVNNFDKEGVCYTKKELVELMQGVIDRL